MIHFNDDTISFGIDKETLCGLSHDYVLIKTSDEVYYESKTSVTCNICRNNLIKTGKIILSRFELIDRGL